MRHTALAMSLVPLLLVVPAASAQEVEEAPVVVPGPEEDLFVDPITDVLAPGKATLRPFEAEIEAARLDVRVGEAELPAARASLRPGRLDPAASVFLDATADENELTSVERVGAGAARPPRVRLSRQATFNRLRETRLVRFGRAERTRSPLAP